MKKIKTTIKSLPLLCLYLIAVPYTFIIRKVIPAVKRLFSCESKNQAYRRAISCTLALVMTVSMIPLTGVMAYAATETDIKLVGDIYEIYTAAGLADFRDRVNGYNGYTASPDINAKLMNDIDLGARFTVDSNLQATLTSGSEWKPIGVNKYNGVFDGNYNEIKGLYITGNDNFQGLFAYAYGEIKNIGLVDSYIRAGKIVGAIAGYSYGAHYTNCYSSTIVISTDNEGEKIGGLVGSCAGDVHLTNCFSTGQVRGDYYVGSLLGDCTTGIVEINNCFYLKGSAINRYNKPQNGIGFKTLFSTRPDVEGCTSKTADEFLSGEVAWLLNTNGGKEANTCLWSSNSERPIFASSENKPTYKITITGDFTGAAYSGTDGTALVLPTGCSFTDKNGTEFTTDTVISGDTEIVVKCFHEAYENGFCTVCGQKCAEVLNGYTYEISNAGQLVSFSERVNAGETGVKGKLMNDIDLTGIAYTPVGTTDNPYIGSFDGNSKTVTLALKDTTGAERLALFGSLGTKASIRYIYVKGTIDATGKYAGGLVGAVSGDNIMIEMCATDVAITFPGGDATVGGIIGVISTGNVTMNNCYASGSISGTGSIEGVGGLCGLSSGSITATNCYSAQTYTNVTAGENLVGNTCTLNSCYYLNKVASSSQGTQISAKQFASGEVAWLLNTKDGTQANSGIWSNDSVKPVFKNETNQPICQVEITGELDATIYTTADGKAAGLPDNYTYVNNNIIYTRETSIHKDIALVARLECSGHVYENGFCKKCGVYEPAVLNGDIYEISNAGQLMWFAGTINAGETTINGKLTNDIDMNKIVWSGINEYGGALDGQGYTIKNLNQNAGIADGARQGFVKLLTSGGTVKNVTFDTANVWDSVPSGAVAYENRGMISNCFVENSYIALGNSVLLGGISGSNYGTITNCAIINTEIARRWSGGGRPLGGITENNNGTVSDCYIYNCRLTGSSTAKGAIVSSGIAPINSYYYTTSDVDNTFGTAKTKEQFNSGEVTYLLNGSTSEGDLTWYQNLGRAEHPSFTGKIVLYNAETDTYYNEISDVVDVTITWGAMEYTYTEASEGTWNPKTHAFENPAEAGWTADEIDSDKITVTSASNFTLNVSFQYTQASGVTVTGSFTDGKNPISTPVPIPAGDTAPQTIVAYLKFDGKPDEAANKAVMGMVTITLGDGE